MHRSCLLLAFLGLTASQPSTTISKEAATTTTSTAFSFDLAPAEGTFVNCGGHFAGTCEDCHPTSPNWCNGECSWENDHCSEVLPIWSAENKTTNSKVPANGIAGPATEKPLGDASKSGSSSEGVSCGGHFADTCRECHSTKKSWCNGDCKWINGFACTYKTKDGIAKEALAAVNKHRRRNGKKALRLDSRLTSSAQDWAVQTASKCRSKMLVHRPLNEWPSNASGGETMGGECEWYPPGSFAVFGKDGNRGWKNSPGHNAIMLKDDITTMGFGFGQLRDCKHWCNGWDSAIFVAMYGN